MIEMRGISKHYGAVQALKEASLSIQAGRITALLGSNGSGKSTLVKVLAGLVNPNAGTIMMDGREVNIRSGNDAQALGISTAFQDLSLVPMMTVEDNLLLGNEPRTETGMINRAESRRIVRELMARFAIHCSPQDYVQSLPPSTQSMLEIAKAVHRNPRVLLLDEATAALHLDEIEVLFDILRGLKQQGLSIVFVTHRMHEVFELCDEAVIMRGGETVISGPVGGFTLDDLVFHMTGQRMAQAAGGAAPEPGQEEGTAVLEVKNLSLPPRVRDVSLTARAGEIIGIGGLEGQGQADFMRAVLGAQQKTGGSIRFLGQETDFRQPAQAVRAGMGFISGERNREAMFPDRTIAENLFAGSAVLGSRFRFLSRKTVRRFSEDAVKTYRIKIGSLKDAASTLSGGNQQKLVIARWIAVHPKLLLLDDPTKGVDIHSRQEIHQILRESAQNGMAVVISASDTDELLEIAQRVYVFYEGKVAGVLQGDGKTQEAMVSLMMGLANSQAEAISPLSLEEQP